MGYDAWLYINKKNHSLKSIEELIVLLGYERTRFGFYYGNDLEYKYNTGVSICEIKKPNDNNYVFHVRAQIWASSYDIELLNRTLRMLKNIVMLHLLVIMEKTVILQRVSKLKALKMVVISLLQSWKTTLLIYCTHSANTPKTQQLKRL